MRPSTKHDPSVARGASLGQYGDEAELYRSHHRDLIRAVALHVNAPQELIEDACQTAWTTLLRRQPDRCTVFGWLRVVAIHEAYRLARVDRRDARLDGFDPDGGLQEIVSDGRCVEDALEAREALVLPAALPAREREYLSLQVAGYSCREICRLAGGRTYTNVNKHLMRARARVRSARTHGHGAKSGLRASS